jgi:hypothetical protein
MLIPALIFGGILFSILPAAIGAGSGDDEYSFQLLKHQPCPYSEGKSKWDRILEFEAGTDQTGPKLLSRPDESNCFNIGGKVTVFKEFRGEFSIYLELRGSASKKQVPESCANRKTDGCGGIGSWWVLSWGFLAAEILCLRAHYNWYIGLQNRLWFKIRTRITLKLLLWIKIKLRLLLKILFGLSLDFYFLYFYNIFGFGLDLGFGLR